MTTGVIPGLSSIGNQLWAIYAPLRKATVQEYDDVRLEMDNYQYMLMKHFKDGVPA